MGSGSDLGQSLVHGLKQSGSATKRNRFTHGVDNVSFVRLRPNALVNQGVSQPRSESDVEKYAKKVPYFFMSVYKDEASAKEASSKCLLTNSGEITEGARKMVFLDTLEDKDIKNAVNNLPVGKCSPVFKSVSGQPFVLKRGD